MSCLAPIRISSQSDTNTAAVFPPTLRTLWCLAIRRPALGPPLSLKLFGPGSRHFVEPRAAAALARSAKTARSRARSGPPCPISTQANPQSHDTIHTLVHLPDRMPYDYIRTPTPSGLTHAMSASLATHTLLTA